MDLSALHAAILQTVRPIPAVNFDDSSASSVSSTSVIDDDLPNIFAEVLMAPIRLSPVPTPRRLPTTGMPTTPVLAAAFSPIPPPAADFSRRDSLEMRYNLEDETKNQLTQNNKSLRQQMAELEKENERLQRQMAVQNKEHRYAQALWNDKLLDLEVELDATKLEHRRIKEAQEDALLEQELDHLKSQLLDQDQEGSSSQHDEEEATKPQSLPAHPTTHDASSTKSVSFATIPSMANVTSDTAGEKAEDSDLQRTIQEWKSKQSLWEQEKEKWESEKSQLTNLIQKMTTQAEDSRIRAEWLERELTAICPSDTDDEEKKEDAIVEDENDPQGEVKDDDDSSEVSAASTKKAGSPSKPRQQTSPRSNGSNGRALFLMEDTPKRLLEQRLLQALESYVQIHGRQDRQIKQLTKELQSLENEKEMDEGLQYHQMAELQQKVSYYQHQLQQTQKALQLQERSQDEFHNEWTKRIEQLELENLKLAKQASNWEEQCVRQTGLLKRQISSLQEKLDQSSTRIKELEQERETVKESKNKGSSASTKDQHAELDAMAKKLKQSKDREAVLERQLSYQSETLLAKEEALGNARERIRVLMAYAGMEESSTGELSRKSTEE